MAFNGDVACDLARQFLELADTQSATAPPMIGHMMMGISQVLVGALQDGRAHLDRAIALYDPAEHRGLSIRFGHDVRMTAFCWRALASSLLGHPDAASDDMARGLEDAREIGHAATTMFVLAHVSLAHTFQRDVASARELAERLVALANEKGSLYWESYGKLLQGWVLAEEGSGSEAVSVIGVAAAAIRSTGATAYAPWYMAVLAKAHARQRSFEQADRSLAGAIEAMATTGERWCEAEVYRTAADIELVKPDGDTAKAAALYSRAIEIARTQKAVALELRAATGLARLWQNQDRGTQALALLSPVLDQFSGDCDTPDLWEARSILQNLN